LILPRNLKNKWKKHSKADKITRYNQAINNITKKNGKSNQMARQN
jgi:hypothetical protein